MEVRRLVVLEYGDNAYLESSAQSMRLQVASEEGFVFTITTCELSGVRTIISIFTAARRQHQVHASPEE